MRSVKNGGSQLGTSDDLSARMLLATLIGLPSLYGAIYLQESYRLVAHQRIIHFGPAMLDLNYAAFEAERALKFPPALLSVPVAGVLLTLRLPRWLKLVSTLIVLAVFVYLHFARESWRMFTPRYLVYWTFLLPTASLALVGATLGALLGGRVARKWGDA